MKKFLLSMLAVLGLGTAYAGNGTQAEPYTVDEVIAFGKDYTQNGVWVKGYIVGTIPSSAPSSYMEYTEFSAKDASNTNLVLAGSSSEDDYNYCIPVQLPAAIRSTLSVSQNPDNIGHCVLLYGNIAKYCNAPGLKEVSESSWVGEAPTPGGGSTGGNTGGGNDDAYLTSGLEPFTIQNVTLPADLSYVWQWDAQYGAKASAYYNSTNYATESYLVSPAITLSADTKTATFSQALNFLNGNNRADYVNVVVREGEGAWNVVNVSQWPAGADWGFVDNCEIDLSAYAGKTIQLAFRYTSSSSCAPTWEVKRVKIGGTAGGNTPSTPTNVMTVTEALAWLNAGNSGNVQATGYITSIKEISTQYGNATYYIGETSSSKETITVYRGNYLGGAKFTSEDQIKVGDLVVVEGNLEFYGNNKEPEFMQGNKIVSLNGTTSGGNTGGNTGGGNDNPGTTPGTPSGNSVTFDFTNPTSLGINVGDETEYDLSGVELENGVVSIAFESADGASTPIRLWSTNGNWTMRFYKDTEFTVTVAEPNTLTGIEFNGTNLGADWTYSNGSLSGSTWTPSSTTNTVTIAKIATGNNPQVKTMKVYYVDAAGVEDIIAADDSEAVYFNLQGVKVANPEHGIFVKVVGGKAVKVVK